LKHALDIGFIALTDAAPLIVAHERGFFAEEGLDVSLRREVSWATIRDKVAAGVYQGAHMLAPMAIATSCGIGSEPAGIIAPLSLNANAAALGVSARLAEAMATADPTNPGSPAAFADAVSRHRAPRGPAVSFGVVFPYSLHNYMLRSWVVAAGLDPDRDMRIVIAPPTSIAARLRAGEIDGFCVGAPWSAACEAEAGAAIVLTAAEFRAGAPDKVLGLSQSWADAEREATRAVTRAVIRAGLWADEPENAGELAALLSQTGFVNAPKELIASNLGAGPKSIAFARDATAFPWRSDALWIVEQMRKWGQFPENADSSAATECYRPDLFREAAAALGVAAPLEDVRPDPARSDS
jgi:ABC-type nitrate/sulfonate/bicarbonate transport system substrate-binding protein